MSFSFGKRRKQSKPKNKGGAATLTGLNLGTGTLPGSPPPSPNPADDDVFTAPLESWKEAPPVLKKMLRFLQTKVGLENIFATAVPANELTNLKRRTQQEKDGITFTSQKNPYLVAELLKNYLESLPDPLMTFDYYDSFILSSFILNEGERIAHLKTILFSLPLGHRYSTRSVFELLSQVVQAIEASKMNSASLAAIFAPKILRAEDEAFYMEDDLPKKIEVTKFLIDRFEPIFNGKEGDALASPTAQGEVQHRVMLPTGVYGKLHTLSSKSFVQETSALLPARKDSYGSDPLLGTRAGKVDDGGSPRRENSSDNPFPSRPGTSNSKRDGSGKGLFPNATLRASKHQDDKKNIGGPLDKSRSTEFPTELLGSSTATTLPKKLSPRDQDSLQPHKSRTRAGFFGRDDDEPAIGASQRAPGQKIQVALGEPIKAGVGQQSSHGGHTTGIDVPSTSSALSMATDNIISATLSTSPSPRPDRKKKEKTAKEKKEEG